MMNKSDREMVLIVIVVLISICGLIFFGMQILGSPQFNKICDVGNLYLDKTLVELKKSGAK